MHLARAAAAIIQYSIYNGHPEGRAASGIMAKLGPISLLIPCCNVSLCTAIILSHSHYISQPRRKEKVRQMQAHLLLPGCCNVEQVTIFCNKPLNHVANVQGPPSIQSQGFEVHVLESSHGWLAANVVSYCPSRTSELQPTVITKHSD